MKKIDTRGFVMVETIIVAVFVMGICAFLFANFIPLIGEYERVEKYDTMDKKYKTNEIRKMILRELDTDNEQLFTNVDTNGYVRYSFKEEDNGEIKTIYNELCNYLDSKNYCNTLLGSNYLNVSSIIITPFKLEGFKNLVKNSKDFSKAEKQYIDYLPSYKKYSSRYDSYYRLIVVYNDGDLSNIEVHYEIG